MTVARLTGGPFDGLVTAFREEAVREGMVIITHCPRHGTVCACGDRMLYAYFVADGQGCGQVTFLPCRPAGTA